MKEPEPFPGVEHHGGGPKAQIAHGCRIANQVLLDEQAQITIGRFSFVGHRVMILTGQHDMFKFGAARQSASKSKPVTIGEGVWICSGAIICPGVTIGDHAVVGPGAVVMRNVPTYGVVAGNPATLVRRLRSTSDGTTAS